LTVKPKKHSPRPTKHPPTSSIKDLPYIIPYNLGDCEDILKKIEEKLEILDCNEVKRLWDSFFKGKRKLTDQLCSNLKLSDFINEILDKEQQNDKTTNSECSELKSKIKNKIRKLLSLT